MAYKDYYSILGVGKNASQDDVNGAYRRLARKFHPDISKETEAESRFKEVGEAYEVLRDPEKRALYDQYGEHWKAVSEGRAAPAGGGQARVDFRSEGFNPDDFGDWGSVFEQYFGGAGPRRRASAGFRNWGDLQDEGLDVEARLELDVEEAYRGGERGISLRDPMTGQARSYTVKIPSGVRSGQKIRLAGQGRSGADKKRGDLFLSVFLRSSARFELDGFDVRTVLDLTPWEAALGASMKMPVLDGSVTVKVPPGSSSGREIRLTGKGYPKGDGTRGDLYTKLRIVVPSRLTDEEKSLFEQLAAQSSFQPRTGS